MIAHHPHAVIGDADVERVIGRRIARIQVRLVEWSSIDHKKSGAVAAANSVTW
jgi:hypothetical protein